MLIKPRNPFSIPARFRKAGVHQKPLKAIRRQEKTALQKQLKQKRSEDVFLMSQATRSGMPHEKNTFAAQG